MTKVSLPNTKNYQLTVDTVRFSLSHNAYQNYRKKHIWQESMGQWVVLIYESNRFKILVQQIWESMWIFIMQFNFLIEGGNFGFF